MIDTTRLARDLDRLTDRIYSARIIVRALVMKGGDTKAVFEAAAGGQFTVSEWRCITRPHDQQELQIAGTINATGRRFRIRSAWFEQGNLYAAAAELGRVALSQQHLPEFPMSRIDRLTEKCKLAAAVAGEVCNSIEERADAILARKLSLKQREDKAFAPHEGLLDDVNRTLDETEAALRLLSNDPLPE